ncbi:MAG: hypothetical protein ACUVT8_02700 [Armatimonadota bacterium]
MENTLPTEPIIIAWTVHLAPTNRAKLLTTLVCILIAAVAAGYVIGIIGSIAVIFALASSLSEFLFPVTYEITPSKAVCKMLFKRSEIKWSQVKKCYIDEEGIKLSTIGRPSRLEAFRGIYLRFNDNRDHVIEAVKQVRQLCPKTSPSTSR